MFYCSLCFTAVSFFIFLSTRDLWGPWADLCEILPHVRKHVQFINAGPKIWGSAPQKKKIGGGGKNMLNLARFRPPSHFERKCFRNGWRYPKSENLVHYSVPSRVQRIKVGKFWCTNHGDLEVQLYPQNRIFWNTIFRPLGGAPP